MELVPEELDDEFDDILDWDDLINFSGSETKEIGGIDVPVGNQGQDRVMGKHGENDGHKDTNEYSNSRKTKKKGNEIIEHAHSPVPDHDHDDELLKADDLSSDPIALKDDNCFLSERFDDPGFQIWND